MSKILHQLGNLIIGIEDQINWLKLGRNIIKIIKNWKTLQKSMKNRNKRYNKIVIHFIHPNHRHNCQAKLKKILT